MEWYNDIADLSTHWLRHRNGGLRGNGGACHKTRCVEAANGRVSRPDHKKKKKNSFFSAKYLLIFSYLKVMYIGPSVAMDAFKAADEQPLHKKMHI